ncbi:MAG: hypothetical protein HGB05_09140 [Chloroflexi bacterium]|nr:hypothetical protein [Chloroflexota bacterium]
MDTTEPAFRLLVECLPRIWQGAAGFVGAVFDELPPVMDGVTREGLLTDAASRLSGPFRRRVLRELGPFATLSDGEEAIIVAQRTCWPQAHPQRCQSHWLGNLAEPVLKVDTQLREQLRAELGGLPAVPDETVAPVVAPIESPAVAPLFCLPRGMRN